MARPIKFSLCLEDILAAQETGHSAFKLNRNGKTYFAVDLWMNDQVDRYGNDISLVLSSTKERRDSEKKTYIGNGRSSGQQGSSNGSTEQNYQPQQSQSGSRPGEHGSSPWGREGDEGGLPF